MIAQFQPPDLIRVVWRGFHLDLPRLIEAVCDRFSSQNTSKPNLDDILAADQWARQAVIEHQENSLKSLELKA